MKPGETYLAPPSSTQRSQSCFYLVLLLLLFLHGTCGLSWFFRKWAFGLVASMRPRDFLLQSLASFGKHIMGDRSKYAIVHIYYPMLTSSSYLCSIWSLNRSPLTADPLSQATYYLDSREHSSMPTQFSIAFATSTKAQG